MTRCFLERRREEGRKDRGVHMVCSGYRQAPVEGAPSGALDLCGQTLDSVVHISVFLHELGNLVDRM
jgi:hypothetical protein